MSIFLDASAIVALIAGEEGADRLAIRLSEDEDVLISAIARWEAIVAPHRSHDYDWHAAQTGVDDLLRERSVRFVPIGELESQLALNAYAQYGKGNHPARLNMGDCFAAACAKANEAWLLFKGDDFLKTDLSWIDRD